MGVPFSKRESNNPCKIRRARKNKNLSESISTFSLSTFTRSVAISKSRRQLSLDSSPTQSVTKRQQLTVFESSTARSLSPTFKSNTKPRKATLRA